MNSTKAKVLDPTLDWMRPNRALVQTGRRTIAVLCLFLFGSLCAKADIFVLISEPYGTYGRLTPTGHSLVGFDRICAAGPIKLRLCRTGEAGAVISRYHKIGGYDWLAIPLMPYLYGVKDAAEVPQFATHDFVEKTRDAYRREYLELIAPDQPDGSTPKGNWYELVGSAYDRSIHVFRLPSTLEQDRAVIQRLNDSPNKSNYHLFNSNCADFVKVILDQIYPGLVTRQFFPDLRITSPRLIAQRITRYSKKHPEMKLEAWTIQQVAGENARSRKLHGPSDALLVSAYAVPFCFIVPVAAEQMAVSFLWHGRPPLYPDSVPVLDPKSTEKEIEEPSLVERIQQGGQKSNKSAQPDKTKLRPANLSPASDTVASETDKSGAK